MLIYTRKDNNCCTIKRKALKVRRVIKLVALQLLLLLEMLSQVWIIYLPQQIDWSYNDLSFSFLYVLDHTKNTLDGHKL